MIAGRSRLKKLLSVVLVVVVALVATLGWQWYGYVNNATSPSDELGIELNSRMPLPLRKWGCDRLKETFGAVLPPHGCGAEDGRTWIE